MFSDFIYKVKHILIVYEFGQRRVLKAGSKEPAF